MSTCEKVAIGVIGTVAGTIVLSWLAFVLVNLWCVVEIVKHIINLF